MPRANFGLSFLEETLWGNNAGSACDIHPFHEIVEFFPKIAECPKCRDAPCLPEAILEGLEFICVFRNPVEIHVKFECFVDSRKQPCEQGASTGNPFVSVLMGKQRPGRHPAEHNWDNDEKCLPEPEIL